MKTSWSRLAGAMLMTGAVSGFSPASSSFAPSLSRHAASTTKPSQSGPLFSARNTGEDDDLGKKFGGYTVKQRLREEVESPFRKVRLYVFGFSAGSAFIALYFSLLTALKASMGGYADVPPLDEALQSVGINVAGLAVCGALVLNDFKAGQANLARIAKGGALARLVVSPAGVPKERITLKDYRRTSRVLIAAGGPAYIEELAKSLCADQLSDENTIPAALQDCDVTVIPVLIREDDTIGETRSCWRSAVPGEGDRNFDSERADEVIAFPQANAGWADYLKSELETARDQGFDVLNKGFTITVKKNGRILRRATGQPEWNGVIGTMEVMDGSKFGMPGDSEKYGGP